jgi:hypothetical protein
MDVEGVGRDIIWGTVPGSFCETISVITYYFGGTR